MAGRVPRPDGEVVAKMAGWTVGIDGWLLLGVWVLVLGITVWALVHEPRRPNRDEARRILQGRLARGEITPAEYEQTRRLLDS